MLFHNSVFFILFLKNEVNWGDTKPSFFYWKSSFLRQSQHEPEISCHFWWKSFLQKFSRIFLREKIGFWRTMKHLSFRTRWENWQNYQEQDLFKNWLYKNEVKIGEGTFEKLNWEKTCGFLFYTWKRIPSSPLVIKPQQLKLFWRNRIFWLWIKEISLVFRFCWAWTFSLKD